MPRPYGDERIVDWLDEHDYHPRSPRHGAASCEYFLADILYESEALADAAASGTVVYQEDYTVGSGGLRWNTDLVLGPPAGGMQRQLPEETNGSIEQADPAEIWLAVDAKSIMTEHGKARRNRQRDINSFADIMHFHHEGAVTGGLLLINMAERFRSPLRDEGDVTRHDNVESLVDETIGLFRDIDRAEGSISGNIDGIGCVIVEHTNLEDDHVTRLVTQPPAPQKGDLVHYRTVLDVLTETLEKRFLR